MSPLDVRSARRLWSAADYETVFCMSEPTFGAPAAPPIPLSMRKILTPLLLCVLASTAAAADLHDDAPIYEGVWNVRLAGQRNARFELRDWAGTWRETSKELPAVCRGRKMPVTVQHSTPEELEFTVWGGTVHKDCPDTGYVFKPRDTKTLDADLATGGKATMTRMRR